MEVIKSDRITFRQGRFNIDEALDSLDMAYSNYTPSVEALEFFAIMRVFYGEDFEVPNCKFHYFIVDMLFGQVNPEDFPYSKEITDVMPINPSRIGILASRGTAKSTITTTFYPIYCAIKGETPLIKNISHMLLLSDTQAGGARDQAKLLAGEFEKSLFSKTFFEKTRFTESEVELVRKGTGPIEKRHILIKFKGAQALSLDSRVYTDDGISCIAHCEVGDRIYGADGKLCTIIRKSEIFNKPMYKLTLKDGRELKVSEDHINSVLYKHNGKYIPMDKTTTELMSIPMWLENKTTGYRTPRIWIKNCEPVEYTEKSYVIDPYTLGLILGDGYFHVNDGSVKLTSSSSDFEFYKTQIPHELGYIETKGTDVVATIKGLSKEYRYLGLDRCKASSKFIPSSYKIGSISQRLALLQGLMDTDGTVAEGKRGTRFITTSAKLCEDVMNIVRSLGGTASYGISNYKGNDTIIKGVKATRNHDVFRVYIKLDMLPVRLPRKVDKIVRFNCPDKVAVISIERIADEESQCIAVDNADRQFLTTNYTRTHNSGGIRSGSRNPITRDRYAIIIGDDVIKNESESYSDTIMKNVRTALESDALNAMRGKNTQLVLINTPFHSRDPVYMSLESGIFTPLVAPICKQIYKDMPESEFEPLWEDMHDYQSVMQRYINAYAGRSTRSFNQELMLRVSNEEDRLITDDMIGWYDRTMLMRLLDGYTVVITTDFTTTSAAKSDFSALAVWAVSSNQDYFLLDTCVRRQELPQQYNELFRMVSTWSKGGKHIEVGIETDGQQRAHIFALKEMMQKKNLYFSFARQKGAPAGREGIQSKSAGGNKLERFRYMLPHFQNHKVYFPDQLKDSADLKEGLKQLRGATQEGFSGHDDFCDVVSQLGMMDIIPGYGSDKLDIEDLHNGHDVWGDIEKTSDNDMNSVVF